MTAMGPPPLSNIPETGTNVVPFPKPQLPIGPMGMAPPPMPPEFQAKLEGLGRISRAIQLIRDERGRGFRVDIEVDSTIFGDSQQEKQDRVQFITVVTQYLQQAMMMSTQVPEIAPLLGKFLQFGVRGFSVGRDLETAIEDFSDQATKLAQQKQQEAKQQPNPQVISAQAEMIKAQSGAVAAKSKEDRENLKTQVDIKKQEQDVANQQAESQAEVARQAIETEGEQHTAQANMQIKQMEIEMKKMDMQIQKMRSMMELLKVQRMQTQNINQAMAE
jgi:flagellar biosynthesis GTPase FlhF